MANYSPGEVDEMARCIGKGSTLSHCPFCDITIYDLMTDACQYPLHSPTVNDDFRLSLALDVIRFGGSS